MNAADIKALRTGLGCSTRELAKAVGVEQETILSWERAETFPTKRAVDRMRALEKTKPSSPKAVSASPIPPLRALADPELWTVIRKLIAHPEFRARVSEIAAAYEDPTD